MEYLQYIKQNNSDSITLSFKPYYKWNTFNTQAEIARLEKIEFDLVLNLIINGIPSILYAGNGRLKIEAKF